MSDNKKWGSTVMGWFVVKDQTEGSDESEAVNSDDVAAATTPQPDTPVFNTPPPPAPGGKVDFASVFEAAGIDGDEQQRVSRTLELLTSLPPGTEDAVKKQIVSASLRAFGVPIEKIIEAGAQELQALDGYIRSGAADTEKVTSEADLRIKQHEEEVVKLRTVMQERVSEQQSVVRSCNDKKLEVQKVLEFFGQEAVARVVRESPKLHEPVKN
jgi:hypothetical protein